jgi:hypothetical protein
MRARLWTEERALSGFSTDVSDSGFYVEANSLFPIGTRVHVELIPPGGHSFLAEAIVVRHKTVPPSMRAVVHCGMGLRLLSLSELTSHEPQRAQEAQPEPATTEWVTVDLSEPTALLEALDQGISEGLLTVPSDGVSTTGTPLAVRVQLPPPGGSVTWKGTVLRALDQSGTASLVLELDDAERIHELTRQILFDS